MFTNLAVAEVYTWKDEAGHVHFSDKPMMNQKAEKINIKTNKNKADNSKEKTASAKPLKQVTMYSTSWCGYCKQAREYFQTNNIPYTDYDIEKNATAKRMYDAFGGSGVPVIFVNDERLNGFNASAFSEIYP
jgi:glutaredoxin